MRDLRVVVADDEHLARRRVRQLIERHGGLALVGEARDGAETVELVRALEPDVLFLDIQMPEMNGFAAMGEEAVRAVPAVVFLTAYAQFAVHAFGVDAVDYLLKPVREERFRDCIRRVRERMLLRRTMSAGEEGKAGADRVIVVEEARTHRRLLTDEIQWIEASDYYSMIHLEGEDLLLREPLGSLEARLAPELFIRVHRSALVNVARVGEVRSAGGRTEVVLRDGTRLPVSRRRKREVLTRLGGPGRAGRRRSE